MKFKILNMKIETIKKNIQIINIQTDTIKIQKRLTYTKTLQMALHNICDHGALVERFYVYRILLISITFLSLQS